jgi:hypothetical protein
VRPRDCGHKTLCIYLRKVHVSCIGETSHL